MMNNTTPFNMDERSKVIAYKVVSMMYFITILSIQFVVLYRQFVLGQELSEFEDIAIIMTINSIFLISALLYFGAVSIRKLQLKKILIIYFLFVIAGIVFTYAKYYIFQDSNLTFDEFVHKMLIVAAIIGLLMSFWVIMSILGNKRTEKELE